MTIEEMASSTYFMQQHSGSLTEEEYEDVKHGIEVRRKAYIKGANAVLEKIEEIIAVGCDDTAFSNLLKGKIEQLKEK